MVTGASTADAALIPAIVRAIHHRLDIHTFAAESEAPHLALNEIGRVTLRLASPIASDPYARCRTTGGFIVIDEHTNNTVGAGLIL